MEGDGGGGIVGMVVLLIQLGIIVAMFASFWVIFTKAGEPGIMGIIPIVNLFFLLKFVTNRSGG